MSTGGESATEVIPAGTEPSVPMDMIPTENGTMNLPEPMNLPELSEPTVLESSPLNLPEPNAAVVDPEYFLMNLPEPMNVTAGEEAPSEVVAEEDDQIGLESRLIENRRCHDGHSRAFVNKRNIETEKLKNWSD